MQRFPVQRVSFALLLTVTVFLSALLLGGASQQHIPGNAILYAISAAALFALAPGLLAQKWPYEFRFALILTSLLFCVVSIQLVPLPSEIEKAFPGHNLLSEIRSALPELSFRHTWTMSSAHTLQSLFSLLPPLAVYAGVSILDYRGRMHLVRIFLLFTFLSVFMGFLQLFGGPGSPLRLYAITDFRSSVGFFANRNHLAALYYCAIPFVAVWYVRSLQLAQPQLKRRKAKERRNYFPIVAAGIMSLVIILGVTMTVSRAGLALSLLAIIATVAIVYLHFRSSHSKSGDREGSKTIYHLMIVFVVALSVAVYYGYDLVISRLNLTDEARASIGSQSWNVVKAFFPFGAGAGTFEPVFKTFETGDTARNAIVNRAHNEYIEWLIDAGAFAIAIFLLAIAWLFERIVRVWGPRFNHFSGQELLLVRTSAIPPVLLLLHSAVDYPLRTGALACLLAACAGFMTRSLGDAPRSEMAKHRPSRSGNGQMAPDNELRSTQR
ncbi:MAG: O-antigen ligase family protein [Beijerinckiaceae bacterium]